MIWKKSPCGGTLGIFRAFYSPKNPGQTRSPFRIRGGWKGDCPILRPSHKGANKKKIRCVLKPYLKNLSPVPPFTNQMTLTGVLLYGHITRGALPELRENPGGGPVKNIARGA